MKFVQKKVKKKKSRNDSPFEITSLKPIQMPNLDLDEIKEAARLAGALEFIEDLPDGFNTYVGERGVKLSGGQKQLLNLASVMVMQPSILILDEPTSQLDPIAAGEFLKTLEKINRELGVTIILTEHRLEDAFPLADRVIVMDDGKIIADEDPAEVGEILKEMNHHMYKALPTPIRVHGEVINTLNCPGISAQYEGDTETMTSAHS